MSIVPIMVPDLWGGYYHRYLCHGFINGLFVSAEGITREYALYAAINQIKIKSICL